MSQQHTNGNALPDVSGEASLEEAKQVGVGDDVADAAQPESEAAPLSEMDFFRKLFFRK